MRRVCALGLMYVPDPRRPSRRCGAPCGRAARRGHRLGRAPELRLGRDISHRRCARRLRGLSAVLRPGAPGALRGDFEKAGLRGHREHRQQETLEFPDEEALLTAMLLGGPVALAVKRFTPEVHGGGRRRVPCLGPRASHRRRPLPHPRRVRHGHRLQVAISADRPGRECAGARQFPS